MEELRPGLLESGGILRQFDEDHQFVHVVSGG
jgi:hypothetical protein